MGRFTFRPGTLLSSELYYAVITHGCSNTIKLCLSVTERWEGSAWQLTPISLSRPNKLGRLLLDDELSDDARSSCSALAALSSAASFKEHDSVAVIISHLNTIVTDPVASKLDCMMEFMNISPVP